MASLIVAGATGAIGRTVVQHAIRQPAIQRVVALTRAANVSEANYKDLFGIVTHLDADANDKKEHASPNPDVVMVTPQEAAKIKPVTLDWEAFTSYWEKANVAATTTPASAESATSLFNQYKEIFSGHTYAAMCLGTTRKDAGSAEQFVRVDYDYVIAFTEAVLAFSAPAGLDPHATYMHHISDGGEVKKGALAETHAADAPAATAATPASAKSTGTLRVFCQVSAARSDSDSWFLYMRTKGNAEEATVERLHYHNKAAAAAGAVPPVLLFLLRPGLLHRHGKTRWNERLAKWIASSIPVETCGAAVVASFVEPKVSQTTRESPPPSATEQARLDTKDQGKARQGENTLPLGDSFKATKTMKKAGVSSAEDFPYIYELTNSAIKHLAGRLPTEKSTKDTP